MAYTRQFKVGDVVYDPVIFPHPDDPKLPYPGRVVEVDEQIGVEFAGDLTCYNANRSWLDHSQPTLSGQFYVFEPPAPRFVPEKDSPVLVRSGDDAMWKPRVFSYMDGDIYCTHHIDGYQPTGWNQCRPFDPAMIGKTDNP